MIAPSARLALPALAILLLGMGPMWWMQWRGPLEDCHDRAALLLLPPVEGSHGLALTTRVIHNRSPFGAYGRPTGNPLEAAYTEDRIEARELVVEGIVIPVHWSSDVFDGFHRLRAYFYVHGGAPTRHPFVSGLARAGQQLMRGTLPVTTYLIDGRAFLGDDTRLRIAAEDWIRHAWLHHRETCRP